MRSESENWLPVKPGDPLAAAAGLAPGKSWVKWKEHSGQAVIDAGDCFYKIYRFSRADAFQGLVREALGRLAREAGAGWEVRTFQAGGEYWQV